MNIFDNFDEISFYSAKEGVEIAKLLLSNEQVIYERPDSNNDFCNEENYMLGEHLWYTIFRKDTMWRTGTIEWERGVTHTIQKGKRIAANKIIRYFKLHKINSL